MSNGIHSMQINNGYRKGGPTCKAGKFPFAKRMPLYGLGPMQQRVIHAGPGEHESALRICTVKVST